MSEIDVHIDGAASQLDGLVGDLCAAIAFNTKGPWALRYDRFPPLLRSLSYRIEWQICELTTLIVHCTPRTMGRQKGGKRP